MTSAIVRRRERTIFSMRISSMAGLVLLEYCQTGKEKKMKDAA